MCLPVHVSQQIASGSWLLRVHVERTLLVTKGVPVHTSIRLFPRPLFLGILLIALVTAWYGIPAAQAQGSSFSNLAARADAGDSSAQYKLAYLLVHDPDVDSPDFAIALRWLRSSAANHSAAAEFILGYLYEHGRGVPVDYGQAMENYLAAAKQGNAGAENNLGALYQHGHGVAQDMSAALQWYQAAAEHGSPVGQYNLATIYYHGHGTAKDPALALKWFRAAADQNLAAAEANLAFIYYNGAGVPVDYTEAARFAKLAAEQGLPHAATNYGYLCEHAKGVPLDYVEAYVWYSRAIAQGDKAAVKRRKEVSHLLTHTQMQRANAILAADASHSQKPSGVAGEGDVSLLQEP